MIVVTGFTLGMEGPVKIGVDLKGPKISMELVGGGSTIDARLTLREAKALRAGLTLLINTIERGEGSHSLSC
jgi:hypothetical protein